jgi:5-methylcytosine-specific restriction protein B
MESEMSEGYSVWIFQANPNTFDLPTVVEGADVGEDLEWSVNQYEESIEPGDLVLLWSASGGGRRERGIYAVARVMAQPYPRTNSEFGNVGVSLVYERILEDPLLAEDLKHDDTLAELDILKTPQGTNFPVTAEQWRVLREQYPELESGKSASDYDLRRTPPDFWKISPGQRGEFWGQWKERDIAAIGWNELGDLEPLGRGEFEVQRDDLIADSEYTKNALNQAWKFSQIEPGDILVANAGISKVLGFGRVTASYWYADDSDTYDEHRHRLAVDWFDTRSRVVDQPGWRRTLLKLDRSDFEELMDADFVREEKAQSPPKVDDSESETEATPPLESAKNVILYGPPGTGKTYSTRRRSVEMCLRPDQQLDEDELEKEFARLRRQGRIEFVTFHQSYAYEEFIEGIRPNLAEDVDDADSSQVAYECKAGILKDIALRAAGSALSVTGDQPSFEQIWGELLERVQSAQDSGQTAYSVTNYRGDEYFLQATSRGNLRAYPANAEKGFSDSGDRGLGASKTYMRPLWERRGELPEDYKDYSYNEVSGLVAEALDTGGGCHGHILWAVLFKLKELGEELQSEGGAPELTSSQRRRVVKDYLRQGKESGTNFDFEDADDFVLVIDEINRGNISKIFGELITLLEPSKRLTEKDELILKLPYSGDQFSLPPNLHVLGTMNTADRSIALLDAALRRRFQFDAMMPEVSVVVEALRRNVPQSIHGSRKDFINLVAALLENLNARIRALHDEDHQIGHTYFMQVQSWEALREVLLEQAIPLIQEYFYGSWENICLVLGCPYSQNATARRSADRVKEGETYIAPVVEAEQFVSEQVMGVSDTSNSARLDYTLSPELVEGEWDKSELRDCFEGVLSGKFYERYDRNAYTSRARS